ncbi:ATP-dependent DNA ligase [Ruminococcus bicirculans (ex Wegman et al. 2014)]|uniref:ATP-dependent DNA ligase n=1 Tax=Ruminococcus bicirculans (ex Wegman et al. 2014) TaxID=1160721 RepID=UPI003FD7B96C
MTDIWETKNIRPMLIGTEGQPFDSDEYIYELKLDGERCIAYLDRDKTILKNKRNILMLPKVLELAEIHKNVNVRCILDGELAVIKDGRPDFFEIQKRSMMSNPVKIDMAAKKYPACFTAFDILYYENRQVTDLPLTERKELLQKAVISENGRFAVSRFIEKNGIQFYALAEQQELEGIVAKRKDSKYYFDKRTKDWIKIKYLQDDDFVVLGYVPKENSMNSIILGQYSNGQLVYKGHVTLGVGGEPFRRIKTLNKTDCPFSEIPKGNENAVWVTPELVCTVKYMMKTESGGMRQPVFKGLREDKSPEECIDNIT